MAGLCNAGWIEKYRRRMHLKKQVCAQAQRPLLGHQRKGLFFSPVLFYAAGIWSNQGMRLLGLGRNCHNMPVILSLSLKGTIPFPSKMERARITLMVALLKQETWTESPVRSEKHLSLVSDSWSLHPPWHLLSAGNPSWRNQITTLNLL